MTEEPSDADAERPAEEPSGGKQHADDGLDLARTIARGLAGRTGALRRKKRKAPLVLPKSSSAHPDDRDPQTLDATLGRFVTEQGWQTGGR